MTPTCKHKKGDKVIVEAAKVLGRSYSWVYVRLPKLAKKDTYLDRGVIYIRKAGIDRLAVMSVRAPRLGRPKKHV
jgi:hypothetical protein